MTFGSTFPKENIKAIEHTIAWFKQIETKKQVLQERDDHVATRLMVRAHIALLCENRLHNTYELNFPKFNLFRAGRLQFSARYIRSGTDILISEKYLSYHYFPTASSFKSLKVTLISLEY